MEKSFKTVIDQSNSILVLLPSNPTFDEVASGLALYLALEGKKDISVSCPTQMRVEHNRLVGVDKIGEEIGNKNLVLRFSDYPSENIERVSYDIENQQFKLSVIPKPQMEPPKKDQVELGYSGVSADTTILVGGKKTDDFPALSGQELAETKIIHVGTNDVHFPEGRKVISLARPAGALSELMADYVKELEGGFHPDIATNLLSGIHEGSNSFSIKGVSANTFKLAGELMGAGGKYTRKEEFRPQRGNFQFPKGMMMPGMPMQMSQGGGQQPRPLKAKKGAFKQDDQSPEKGQSEAPEGESTDPNTPKSWLKPKIYKGTSVS